MRSTDLPTPLIHRLTLVALFTVIFHTVAAQQPTTVPDGTMGLQLENLDVDSTQRKGKRWRLFNGRFSSFKLGGGYLYEFAGYSQDAASKRQMDSAGTPLVSAFKVRDFRLVASGQLKTKRTITWRAGFMYDGVTDRWFLRETGLMIDVPEISGHIFIGRTKEGFSMNKVMNGYAGWTLERQMALDVIPILADGIKWLGFLPRQRILWNIGAYFDYYSEGQSFSTYQSQVAGRLGWLPVYSRNRVLHVGMSYRHGRTLNGQIRLRSRPEANPAPYFIDTGTFSANSSDHIGGEAYYSSGPLMLGTEFYFHNFNSTASGNPSFFGGDMVVSYILTGQSRPYNTTIGIYGFVPVDKPVFKGGFGTWEVLIRYSTLDLNSGVVKGGAFWRITPMVNWYMTKTVRLEFAYGYGVLDRFSLTGATQFFQTRVQIVLL